MYGVNVTYSRESVTRLGAIIGTIRIITGCISNHTDKGHTFVPLFSLDICVWIFPAWFPEIKLVNKDQFETVNSGRVRTRCSCVGSVLLVLWYIYKRVQGNLKCVFLKFLSFWHQNPMWLSSLSLCDIATVSYFHKAEFNLSIGSFSFTRYDPLQCVDRCRSLKQIFSFLFLVETCKMETLLLNNNNPWAETF